MIYCVHSLMQHLQGTKPARTPHTQLSWHQWHCVTLQSHLCLIAPSLSVCSSLPYLLAPFLNPASRHAPTPVKKIWQFRLQPLNGLMQWNSYAHFDAYKSHLLKHTHFFYLFFFKWICYFLSPSLFPCHILSSSRVVPLTIVSITSVWHSLRQTEGEKK